MMKTASGRSGFLANLAERFWGCVGLLIMTVITPVRRALHGACMLVVTILVVSAIAVPASAGGSWLELRRVDGLGAESTDVWGGWASSGSDVFMQGDFCDGQQADPSVGPWTAYLRRDPSGPRQALGAVNDRRRDGQRVSVLGLRDVHRPRCRVRHVLGRRVRERRLHHRCGGSRGRDVRRRIHAVRSSSSHKVAEPQGSADASGPHASCARGASRFVARRASDRGREPPCDQSGCRSRAGSIPGTFDCAGRTDGRGRLSENGRGYLEIRRVGVPPRTGSCDRVRLDERDRRRRVVHVPDTAAELLQPAARTRSRH